MVTITVIGEAFIAVRPDSKGFGPETEKGVLSQVGSIAKKAAAILGGAFVAQKGLDLLRGSLDEAREAQKVGAQTEAVIKSTGAAANVSAEQVDKLATALSRKTGIDDEQIAKAENLLLTFTNVRNEVGKGNDVFNQASKTLVDMGAALGTDAAGSAIQLGKALNDPVAGITALTRVGVTFTQQQKDQIKALTESGNILGAQKIILAELNKEFGGSAEAQATATDRLRVTVGNIKEQIGTALIPIIDRAATFLADRLPGAIDAMGRGVGRVVDVLRPVAGAIKQTLGVLFAGDFDGGPFAEDSPFIDAVFRFRETLQSVLGTITENVRLFFGALTTGFTEDEGTGIERFALFLRNDVLPVVQQVAKFVGDNLKPILIGLGVAFVALTAPITGAVAGLIALYIRFQAVRDVADGVVSTVRVIVGALAGFVAFIRTKVIPAVAPVIKDLVKSFSDLARGVGTRLEEITEAVRHVLQVIKVVVAVGLAPIVLLWRAFGDQITSVVRTVFGVLRSIFDAGMRVIRDVIDLVLSLINGDWGKAWNALKDIPLAVMGAIRDIVEGGLRIVGEVIQGALRVLALGWSTFWDGLKAAPGAVKDAVVGIVKDIGGAIAELPGRIAGVATQMLIKARELGGAIVKGIGEGLSEVADFAGDVFKSVLGVFKSAFNFVIDKLEAGINRALDLADVAAGPLLNIGHVSLDFLKLAKGALVRATPGGTPAIIGEGGRDEAVIPLPPGLLAGLQQLARGGNAGGGPTFQVENMTVVGNEPEETVSAMFDRLALESWLAGAA